MKKALIFVSLSFIMSFISSCDLLGEELGKCGKDVEVYEQKYDVNVRIFTASGGIPIEGLPVKIETWKEHCDGHKGFAPGYPFTGTTNFNGDTRNPFISSYSMKTEKDKIHTKITVYDRNNNVIEEDGAVYSYWDCVNRITPTYDEFLFRVDDKYYIP